MTPHAPTGAGNHRAGRRRRGPGIDAVVIGVAAALFAHGVAFLVLEVVVPSALHLGGAGHAARAAEPAAPVRPLDPSCDGDALLRAAARVAYCATPFVADPDACLADAESQLESDFILCHLDTFALLPPLDAEQLARVERARREEQARIEAEPLVDPLTPEQLAQLAQLVPPPAPPPPAAPPLSAQVIETVRPDREEAPDQARFLSEYDTRVEKQTVARGARHEEIAARPKAEELAVKQDPKEANRPDPAEADPGREDAPKAPGALSMRAPGAPETGQTEQARRVAGERGGPDEPGDGVRKRGDGAIERGERRRADPAAGDGGGGGGTPRAPNLRPDDQTLERVAGGGSVDAVDDVEEGDENAFNSKRWVHASFFNRMKRQVGQMWDPGSVWRREDPDGTKHGHTNRHTQLRVSLDARGRVVKIIVSKPCGVPALDDEAVRAFQAAGPFPNPPQALVDRQGLISFEFGFSFNINAKKTSWTVRRGL